MFDKSVTTVSCWLKHWALVLLVGHILLNSATSEPYVPALLEIAVRVLFALPLESVFEYDPGPGDQDT